MKLWVCLLAGLFVACSAPVESKEAFYHKRGMQYIKVGDTELTSKMMKMDSARANDAFVYFDVTINRLKDEALSKDKSMYLDFDVQKDFGAAVGNDSLIPALCQRVMNGKSKSFEYLIAFEKRPALQASGITLVYDDKIFGVGRVAFAYQANDLKEPKL